MVEIDLKVGKGKSRGNRIAVQTELAPTWQMSLYVKKAVRNLVTVKQQVF